MTYSKKLQHPKWQKRRLEILTRDNFTCQLCGDTETQLHIHHKYYVNGKDVWDYPDDALITYCKYCHSAIEIMKLDGQTPIVSKQSETSNGFDILLIAFLENGVFAVNVFLCEQDAALFIITIRESSLGNMIDLIDQAKGKIK